MKFRIPVDWTMKGEILIEDNTLKEAFNKIYNEKIGLPYNPVYVDGSMNVNLEEFLLCNEEVSDDALDGYFNNKNEH
jgi:hypothetical protein